MIELTRWLPIWMIRLVARAVSIISGPSAYKRIIGFSTYRDQFHARNLHGKLRVSLALNARPNQRELNMIVGRDRRGRFRLNRPQRMHLCPKQRVRSRGSRHF
jgi:hypothetical protein